MSRGVGPQDAKIALIGDRPSVSAKCEGLPFGGWERQTLENLLLKADIHPSHIYMDLIDGDPDSVIKRLNTFEDLRCVITLGEVGLITLAGYRSIDKWHLSPLDCVESLKCRKAVPTYDMRRLAKDFSIHVHMVKAFERARKAAEAPGPWDRPKKNYLLNPDFEQTMTCLANISRYSRVACDIETGHGIINTVGFALSPTDAIAIQVLPDRLGAEKYYLLWSAIAKILENPRIGKIFQNLTYESMYFSRYGIAIQNYWHDTMWAQKMLWPEFEMGLASVGRFYTHRPYWKDIGKEHKSEGGKKDWGAIKDWVRHFEYNCLSKDTKVLTTDGWLTIGSITRNKLQVTVCSLNENTGEFEWKPVTNWLRRREPETVLWRKLKLVGNSKHGQILTTQDHKFLTPDGWKEAQDIQVGDQIINRGVEHDCGALLGTIMGDSAVGETKAKGTAYLGCAQVHKELIDLKHQLFGGTYTEITATSGYVKGPRKLHSLYVPTTPQLYKLKHLDTATKLENLNSMGIALWFMDDGCKQKGRYPHMKLALQGYSKGEQLLIRDWFKTRYDDAVSLDSAGNISFGRNTSKKLCEELGVFIPPQLRYKMSHPGPAFQIAKCLAYRTNQNAKIVSTVEAVSNEHKTKRGYKTVHCISVRDNHNFLTNCGIVANCEDTTGTFEAAMAQRADMEARGLTEFFESYLMRLAPAIAEMCARGLPVNETTRVDLGRRVSRELEAARSGLSQEINPGSWQQKLKLLESKGYKIPKKRDPKTGKSKPSTDEKSLKKLRIKYPEDKDLDCLLRYAKAAKALGSYIDVDYDSDGYLRYMINGTGTETLRFSSSKDPWDRGLNAQTLPKDYKIMFDAPRGKTWIQIDLAQAESRFVAYDACDENLIRMLEDPAQDIHSYVASHIFEVPIEQVIAEKNSGDPSKRQLGKKSGHGANYSMAATTFVESCLKEMDLVISKAMGTKVLETYHRLFPGIRRWHEEIKQELYKKRKLANPLGFERYFYGRLCDNTFREAYAFKPQSTIPMITNYMMLHLLQQRDAGALDFTLHLQCHDSITLMCDDTEAKKLPIIETALNTDSWHPEIILPAGRLVIPTSVEVGTNMGKLEEIR